MATLYTHQTGNIRKTWVIMTGFLVLVIGLGFLFSQAAGSPVILYISIGLSLFMNFVAYWKSDSIALASSGAVAVTREQDPRLYRIVENLAITAGLPLPRLYLLAGEQINAFATGRDPQHAAVAVTQGALAKLDDNELTGVLAHELSHVGNRDILVSSVAVVLAGVIATMADIFLRTQLWRGSDDRDGRANAVVAGLALLSALLAPLAASLMHLAVSRKREYLADTSGALLTRYPEGLASALEKIAHDQAPLPHASSATAHLYLANPFRGRRGTSWFTKLFMTHPPLEDRIKLLRAMDARTLGDSAHS